MQGPSRIMRAAFRQVVDFALPPRCPGCGTVVETPDAFCLTCWSAVDWLGPPCCDGCALPFDYEAEAGSRCGACLAEPPAFDRLRAAVAYGEIARTVALKLKYGRRPAVAGTMARFMARHLETADAPILCPVPLHPRRIWRRGYNQAALIAAALARPRALELRQDLLLRVKATPPLKEMSPAERQRTVRGAFRLNPRHVDAVKGRTVVIVDDVFTSGATLSACARVLKRGGAARVSALCWARVVRGD